MNRAWRWLVPIAALLGIVAAVTMLSLTRPLRIEADALPTGPVDPARGKLVFDAAGCAACHATPGGDPLTLGGGMTFKTAFGTFHAPNISPDPEAGIGGWSEADFASAVMRGTSPDGQHLYPVFPYTSYQRMAPQDVRDLFAYIRTLPPSGNRAPPHELPFPYNIRLALGGWKLINLDGRPFAPDPGRSEQWNRGAYLAEAMAHCAECHSPRDRMGGIVTSRRYGGGEDPEGRGRVPNITPHADGIADWSEEDIYVALTDGTTPGFDSLGGTMAAVVRNMAKLPDADRHAIAHYIKTLPPVAGK